jgi:hypothetical protein
MIGRMNTLILSIGLCVVSCFALWMPAGESTAMIIVFAVIFGFVSGSNLSLSPVCVGMDPLWTAYLLSSAIFFEHTSLSRHSRSRDKLCSILEPHYYCCLWNYIDFVILGQMCKTENYGRYFATCWMVVAFGTLTGLPIAGQILTACGGKYWGLIFFAGIAYAGAGVCLLTARVLAVGWKVNVIY